MLSTLKQMLWKLPTKFTKKEDSTFGKIFQLFAYNHDLLKDNFEVQLEWRNIDKAQGIALDNIGKMVGLPRGTLSDEQYRVRIKIKIAQNISNGTINNVIEILAATLDIPLTSIQIKTLWSEGKPATIQITKIPAEALNASGMTPEELVEIVKLIVASGIDVEIIELVGTFVFSSIKDQNENNPTGGFDVGKFGSVMNQP